jgi:NTE family protein
VTTPDPRHVLVLQGGGALGAYQAGVYEALSQTGSEPDWIAGISIGAINAALIAGNPPELRLERLREFWNLVTSGWSPSGLSNLDQLRSALGDASIGWAMAAGVPGFFTPRALSPLLLPDGPETLSFYDSSPLRATLERLVDFDRINAGAKRFSVGAVNIRTGNFAYFDNAHQKIGPEHIMASGALPPGLPPIEIDGEWYWDGGLVSNTPLEYVLDQDEPEDLVIYQVDLFSARGRLPRTMQDAGEREKDIRYSSRTRLNTDAQLRIHRLKTALGALLKTLPADLADDPEIELLSQFAREPSVTVVQLIYRDRPYEGSFKDVEFSRQTMLDHWSSGLKDGERAIARRRREPAPPKPGDAVAIDPGLDRSDEQPSRNPAKDTRR